MGGARSAESGWPPAGDVSRDPAAGGARQRGQPPDRACSICAPVIVCITVTSPALLPVT
jgi:hypothetical protein